jgi:hypothetical protein
MLGTGDFKKKEGRKKVYYTTLNIHVRSSFSTGSRGYAFRT